MPEKTGDFEAFAKVALGTDDPERLAAFKEAVMACQGADAAGEFDEGLAEGEGEGLGALFGGG